MKRNKVILGTIGVVAAASAFVFKPWESNDSDGLYSQNNLSALEAKDANDARIWMEARYTDPETGERFSAEKMRQITEAVKLLPKNKSLSFVELGPDNIGGRTRAIQPDRTVANKVWAGGVSGGLFVSENGGNHWDRVDTYDALGSPFISSMAQFSNGTLFVATGSDQESWTGDGVWYTTDAGASWTQVPGTSSLSRVTEVVAPVGGNTLWLTSSSGLKKWTFGDTGLTSISVGTPGGCSALQCSPNGSVFVAAIGSNKTFVSSDGGNNWTDMSGTATSLKVPSNASRIEYAVSPTTNSSGKYSLYAVRTASNLSGMHVSHDNGATWYQFVGASGTPSNLDIYRNQGTYNSIVSVSPSNPEKILIGGIDIWKWEQTTTSPQVPSGGFEKLTQWFLAPSSPKYAHADNHEMKWDGSKLYIGNDGGIGITYNPEGSWYPSNRGYNVTQFYGIAFDRSGSIMGGAQDNGSLYNDHTMTTWQEFREVTGGDGFQCEISFYNPEIIFSSSQFGSIFRSGDRGQTADFFVPNPIPSTYAAFGTEGSIHPFHTQIFLAENYDLNSEDSITFIPTQNYSAGSVIPVASLATGDTIMYTTPTALYYDDTLNYKPSLTTTETSIVNATTGSTVYLDLYNWSHYGTSGSGQNPPQVGDTLLVDFPAGTGIVVVGSVGTFQHYFGQNTSTGEIFDMGIDQVAYGVTWDTVRVQDPFQSWFIVYVNVNGGELWGTRNALRLSAQDDQWGIIAQGIGGGGFGDIEVEFSRDLNHMFVSTGGTTVTRIDGLGSQYTSNPNFESNAFIVNGTPAGATQKVTFNPGTSVEGIAVNPSNPDDFIAVSVNGSIRRSANATAATPTFSSLTQISSPSPAIYDMIIDRNDSDILVAGTSHGVFVSENGGASWTEASTGFLGTPVYEVRQSWRSWNEGNFRPGEIYIGTFGRGIWSSASYLGIGDNNSGSENGGATIKTKLTTYPNPTSNSTTLSFQLSSSSDVVVNVYNLSGRLVKTIKQAKMSAGANLLNIDASDLSSGTYIVKFQAGSQQETTKFVKM